MARLPFLRKTQVTVRDDQRTKASELTLRQSLYPIILVTTLFFLWGFSYGLLDTLNKHFQVQMNITQARSSGLQAAYFGAYPLASLGHANWLLRRWGYKVTFIWGLCLYGVGALVAWPCLLHRSFGGFCAAIFIIGNGLGSLETAANPYITVCGPPRYSEIRINISQAFNGIGTVVAPVMSSYVFFTSVHDDDPKSLQNVQWVYLAIACFVFLLAVVFFFSPIPEITDADMEFQVHETNLADTNVDADAENQVSFRKQYRLFHAAFAQFCYTGSQVAIAGYFINYAVYTRPGTSDALGSKLLAGAQASFALGRFVGSAIMHRVKPRLVFVVFMTMCIVFLAPAITQRGNIGISMLYVVLFFESICFPTIVALGMRGLGRHTKRGSGFIVAGVSGGALVPPLLGVAADANNKNTALAMVVPLIFFVAAETYAVAVNTAPRYVSVADRFLEAEIGVQGATDVESGEEKVGEVDAARAEKEANAL